jgi:LAO/AO transport system kinase
MDETFKRMLEGDRRALSRLISLLERGDPQAARVMEEAHPYTGRAYCIGVTGLPGSGKSTLIDRLTEIVRGEGRSVGIVAVDPTSPYSGGALLGDRVRMQRHSLDPGVFIRSMATRGSYGGLPRVIKGVVRLLEASGKEVVMVETVGVGQTELSIMGVADTVVVSLMPEAGDAIQALKAGLMEIADIFVVNKADREGADQVVMALRSMLNMVEGPREWTPPVLTTQAHKGIGIEELYQAIQEHHSFLERTSHLERKRRERRRREFLETIEEGLSQKLKELVEREPGLSGILERIERGEVEPYSAALGLLKDEALLRYWLSNL